MAVAEELEAVRLAGEVSANLAALLEAWKREQVDPAVAWMREHGIDPAPLAPALAGLLLDYVEGLTAEISVQARSRAARRKLARAARRN